MIPLPRPHDGGLTVRFGLGRGRASRRRTSSAYGLADFRARAAKRVIEFLRDGAFCETL